MMTINDGPIITRAMRTGYGYGEELKEPKCPVCGEECDTFYRNADGEIVGCDECITALDAWEVTAE